MIYPLGVEISTCKAKLSSGTALRPTFSIKYRLSTAWRPLYSFPLSLASSVLSQIGSSGLAFLGERSICPGTNLTVVLFRTGWLA